LAPSARQHTRGPRRVRVHRPGRPPRDLGEAGAIDGEDVVPGWRLPLAELFA